MSSVFFFKDVGEHSDVNKEGFKKYPLISSLLSAKVLTVVVSVVFDNIEKTGRVIFSKPQYIYFNILLLNTQLTFNCLSSTAVL